MCVFLCANPNVHAWLDVIVARSERQSLQLSALCPGDPYEEPNADLEAEPGASPLEQGAHSSRNLDYRLDRLRYERADCGHWSPPERHHSLEALANAWARFLGLVGWRR